MKRSTHIHDIPFLEEGCKLTITSTGIKTIGQYLDLSTEMQHTLCTDGRATRYHRAAIKEGLYGCDECGNKIELESSDFCENCKESRDFDAHMQEMKDDEPDY